MGVLKFGLRWINLGEVCAAIIPQDLEPRQRSVYGIAKYSKAQGLLYKSYSHYTLTMESLLSLSFDYLSSNDGIKIRKGLRQLEGLLAQICLSRSSSSPADRRSSVVANGAPKQSTKELSSLKNDPAFREFFKLQEGFEWNGKQSRRLLQKHH